MSIVTAAGIGMALISTEHFYSTLLSSPWTVGKFVETEEDRRKIRQYYIMAAVASLVTAYILARILDQSWPIIATLILCVFYIAVYENAMREKLGSKAT